MNQNIFFFYGRDPVVSYGFSIVSIEATKQWIDPEDRAAFVDETGVMTWNPFTQEFEQKGFVFDPSYHFNIYLWMLKQPSVPVETILSIIRAHNVIFSKFELIRPSLFHGVHLRPEITPEGLVALLKEVMSNDAFADYLLKDPRLPVEGLLLYLKERKDVGQYTADKTTAHQSMLSLVLHNPNADERVVREVRKQAKHDKLREDADKKLKELVRTRPRKPQGSKPDGQPRPRKPRAPKAKKTS